MKVSPVAVVVACLLVAVFAEQESPEINTDLFEGDLRLTPEERSQIYQGKYTFGSTKNKWPTTTIPYTFGPELGAQKDGIKAITDGLNQYHRHTCIKFVPRTTERNYMEFHNGQGCSAPFGWHSGVERISLPGSVDRRGRYKGCWISGTVVHEIMHNLGFLHEQARPDRDKYVKILWKNISPRAMTENFHKGEGKGWDPMGSPYDYSSVMHYPGNGFAKKGTLTIMTLDRSKQNVIGQRERLSAEDIRQINKAYNCGPNPRPNPPLTPMPPVCKDVYRYCQVSKCNRPGWKSYMRSQCKKTCNFCG